MSLLVDKIFEKLNKWVDEALSNPENAIPPWDMTNDKPTDIWINTAALILIKLLRLKALSEGEKATSLYDSSPIGVICRAEAQNKLVSIVIVAEEKTDSHYSKEEASLIQLYVHEDCLNIRKKHKWVKV